MTAKLIILFFVCQLDVSGHKNKIKYQCFQKIKEQLSNGLKQLRQWIKNLIYVEELESNADKGLIIIQERILLRNHLLSRITHTYKNQIIRLEINGQLLQNNSKEGKQLELINFYRTATFLKNQFCSKLRKSIRKLNKFTKDQKIKDVKQFKQNITNQIVESNDFKRLKKESVNLQDIKFCQQLRFQLLRYPEDGNNQKNYNNFQNSLKLIHNLETFMKMYANLNKNKKKLRKKYFCQIDTVINSLSNNKNKFNLQNKCINPAQQQNKQKQKKSNQRQKSDNGFRKKYKISSNNNIHQNKIILRNKWNFSNFSTMNKKKSFQPNKQNLKYKKTHKKKNNNSKIFRTLIRNNMRSVTLICTEMKDYSTHKQKDKNKQLIYSIPIIILVNYYHFIDYLELSQNGDYIDLQFQPHVQSSLSIDLAFLQN